MKFRHNRLICFILAAAMLVSVLPVGIWAQESETEDLFVKFADKGIMTEASSEGDASNGVYALSKLTGEAYENTWYSVDDTEGWTAAGITQETVDAAKAASISYVTLEKDGAWAYDNVSDSEGTAKDTWFVTKNYRQNGSYKTIGGNLYFGIEGSAITPNDSSLTFIFEYLDVGTGSITLRYCTGGTANQTANVARENTNTWKTAVISVSDAVLSPTNTGTGLGTGREDFRIEANSVNTYISRMMVIKTSDYLGTSGEQEVVKPDDTGTKIFLAGDSLCEILPPKYYPREGWGMEISDFFTPDVKFINKAKGGKSTRTFLSGHDPTAGDDVYDTRMTDIISSANKGDFLLVNLGTNDALNSRDSVKTDASTLTDSGDGTSYKGNLIKFIELANENELNLVFITPARIRKFNIDGTIGDDGIEAYRTAMKEIGNMYGVPVLDLGTAHAELVESLGSEYSKLVYMFTTAEEYPNLPVAYEDNTHINRTGAIEICKLIVKLIKEGAEAGDDILSQLYSYVDIESDTTPITKPVYQSFSPDYDVTDIVYTVDGEESDTYYAGAVSASATVKNSGSSANTATLYLAVYDEDNRIVDISKSDAVSIEAGASAQVTAEAVELPDLDGYKFRRFIWASNLRPYSDEESKLILTADGYNSQAILQWTEYEEQDDDVVFEIYRDDILIAETKGGAYIDENVTRGEHSYQINAVNSAGEVLYQSAYAIATVTSMDDLDDTVVYAKARLNMNGEEEDVYKGITCYRTSKLYPTDEAQAYYSDLTDEMVTAIQNAGVEYTHSDSDGPVVIRRVTDDYGITKDAWFTTKSYCYTDKREGKQIKNSFMYFNVLNKSITPEDSTLTVFVDFLANRSGLVMTYGNATIDGETVTQGLRDATVADVNTRGWRTARFDLTDAYFDQTSTGLFNGATDLRFASGGTDLYISSVTIVKGTGSEALTKYASVNPGFTNNTAGTGTRLYPHGVSIDFTSGEAVMNGIRSFRREDNNNADASAYIAQDDDGDYYVTTQRAMNGEAVKQTFLYFAVDDNYMFGNADSTALFEITYKAEYDTPLNLYSNTYNKSSGQSTYNISRTVAQLEANEEEPWQTVAFTVDGIAFNNTDNGGGDFRLSIPAELSDPDKQLKIRKLTIKDINSAPIKAAEISTIPDVYIAGDSIAAPYSSGSTTIGWGMRLPNYTMANVVNKAVAGSSTKTFPNMDSILSSAGEGDYVFMQFGHNDSMSGTARYVDEEQYKLNLKEFVKNVRKAHAIPVILTSIPRYSVSDGTLLCGDGDGIEVYRDAAIAVAQEMNVAYIDTASKMVEKTADLDSAAMEAMFVDEGNNNRVHLTESGAVFMAELIAEEIKNNDMINILKDYMK
ncbi:MAG: hypothetical protein IJ460_01315 [Clostridia bacterium]|nr:hypothetical protein [Clostridia bacterium]